MMRRVWVAVVAAWLVIAAAGADLAGTWSGDVPGRGGDATPATFVFKVAGDKLTGTMKGAQGETALQDGKVSGDQLSFTTTFDAGGTPIKILYKGVFAGDQLKMTRQREGGSGQAREFTLKRTGA